MIWKLSVLIPGFALLAGCVDIKAAGDLAKELSKDKASVCVAAQVGVGGGALTLVPAPTVPVAGGLGHILIGRTNQPGSKLTVTPSSCSIQHGVKEWTVEEALPVTLGTGITGGLLLKELVNKPSESAGGLP